MPTVVICHSHCTQKYSFAKVCVPPGVHVTVEVCEAVVESAAATVVPVSIAEVN